MRDLLQLELEELTGRDYQKVYENFNDIVTQYKKFS